MPLGILPPDTYVVVNWAAVGIAAGVIVAVIASVLTVRRRRAPK